MLNKLFEKINLVCVLRVAGLVLLALYIWQGIANGARGAEWDDALKLFVITIANGIFQPLVLLGLAEIIHRKGAKAA